MKIVNGDLQYLIDHIFLPPRLPQEHDSDTHRKDSLLLNFVTETLETFANTLAKSVDSGTSCDLKVWVIIQKMLNTMAPLYADGGLIRDEPGSCTRNSVLEVDYKYTCALLSFWGGQRRPAGVGGSGMGGMVGATNRLPARRASASREGFINIKLLYAHSAVPMARCSFSAWHPKRLCLFSQLEAALQHMDINDVLPVIVEAQNAGVIFRKISQDILTFEAFEVSLASDVVMGACGKISMRFPANPRLPFPAHKIVISTLANVLAHLSTSLMEEAIPFTKKGGEDHHEVRNTASPRFITEALAGIIRSTPPTGQLNIETTYIKKRLNDHVLWKSALKPWRRSSMWLVTKVAMQTTLKQWGAGGAHGYKASQAFIMASLLEKAISRGLDQFPCDLLHTMNLKVVRRLCQMGDVVEGPSFPTIEKVSDTVRLTATTLGDRWKEVQRNHESTIQWANSNGLNFEGCLDISFPNSQDYLGEVIRRGGDQSETSSTFNRKHLEEELRTSHNPRNPLSPARLPSEIASRDILLGLYNFESWVRLHLTSWKQSTSRSEGDCLPLKVIIDSYREVASKHYEGKPEQTSLMYLCILELWVALDALCLKWCSLFRNYSPEIPEDFLDPLILPYPEQIQRLAYVQHYLRSRHQGARRLSGRSIFQGVNDADSFQNQYFKQRSSQAHPLVELGTKIRAEAVREKAEKLSELQRRNESHARHMRWAQDFNCVSTSSYRNGVSIPDHRWRTCQKCQHENSARALRVVPFEEPLPESSLFAQPIIFELACPAPFAIWRDVTIKIVSCSVEANLTSASESEPDAYPLDRYTPLARYFRKSYLGHFISLASSAKSLSRSHYGDAVPLPATEDQVLFKHEGSFRPFDLEANEWLDQRTEETLRPRCTFRAQGLYAPLQIFLDDTTHFPNSVLASQGNCPIGVTLAEYITFGQLRAGNRIQWPNIMRAIRTQSLPFSEPGVFALIVQSIWQAGPIGEAVEGNSLLREAHVDLLDEKFGKAVANELLRATRSIGSNWKEASFLAILVILALRLHAFSPHLTVRSLARQLLDKARDLVMDWIKWLLNSPSPADKAEPRRTEEPRDHRAQALATVALVLRASFDVEATDGSQAFQTRSDTERYIYAGILISAVHIESFPPCLSILASRNYRLTLNLESQLIQACLEDPSVLYCVGVRLWPELSAETQWEPVSSCQNHWWTSMQAERGSKTSLTLHMNIIEGIFLVNGQPLHQLPTAYREDPLYRSLFSDYVFGDVGPSQIFGMEFRGLYKTQEVRQVENAEPEIVPKTYEIHFGMSGRKLIILRRQGEDLQEYIPTDRLERDLPMLFYDHHRFWYSQFSNAIEIRPQSQLWINDEQPHWKVDLSNTKEGHVIGKAVKQTVAGSECLVDPHSMTHITLARALAPFESDSRGVFVTVIKKNDGRTTTSIRLPRHDLSFALEHNELECLSVRGFVVDYDLNGIGCLFGLRSVLNLRHKDHRQLSRKIVVPKGSMISAKGYHGHVDIIIDSRNTRGYFVYDVDPLLGRLVGTRSMESDLFLVKLHACTASHLPDPLTRKTGTVEALHRLESASSFSFYTISEEARSYLDEIAMLTPRRSFYPTYLRVMETVEWNSHLAVCAQHPGFFFRVQNILSHGRNMGEFIQDMQFTEELKYPEGMEYLINRTMQRDWIYSYHADSHPLAINLEYDGRDSLTTPDSRARENKVFQIATLTRKTTPGFPICRSLRDEFLQQHVVEGCQKWGWSNVNEWLRVPKAPSIAETWCTFYELCRAAQSPNFEIATVLAFQRYRGVPLELVASLIAVINEHVFSSTTLACPQFSRLQLKDGHTFNRPAVLPLVQEYKIPFTESQEYKTAPLSAESDLNRVVRAQKAYEAAVKEESDRFVNELAASWPALPAHLGPSNRRLLNLTAAKVDLKIRPILACWAQNAAFFSHVQMVQDRLNRVLTISDLSCEDYIPRYPTLIPASGFSKPSLKGLMLQPQRNPGTMNVFMTDSSFTSSPLICERQDDDKDLLQLLQRLDKYAHNPFKRRYLRLLRESLDALKLHSPQIPIESFGKSVEDSWELYCSLYLKYCIAYFDQIFSCLSPRTNASRLLHMVGIWPEVSPYSLLRSLSKQRREALPLAWISHLINYAISIHDVKRAARVFQHARAVSEGRGNKALLEKELQYKRIWNPSEHPDWLLIEIDGNISVRAPQVEVARVMLQPAEGQNAIMQLNMGEGKSSGSLTKRYMDRSNRTQVIVPIVAVSTANGDKFARVMVPRAQIKQQFQILRQTITGLCDRRIIYLPFNRNLPLDAAGANRIHELLRANMGNAAVFICEPESALSLKLLGIDKSMRKLEPENITDRTEYRNCSRKLTEVHLWLHENSKDIIDESDEVLNVRQQVVYTTGPQQDLDSGPLRCMVIQKVLGLLAQYLAKHSRDDSVSPFLIETRINSKGKASFPSIRIHSDTARQSLGRFIRASIHDNDWPLPAHMKEFVADFVTSSRPTSLLLLLRHIRDCCSGEDGRVMDTILILRGIIGCDILLHCLKEKRWRVQYGLDLERSKLAIPFRAKDTPSPKSEFSHPDVTILLTCLSYYYGGLHPEMITQALQSLLSSDMPELTYTSWLKACLKDVPLSLHTVKGINLQDQELVQTQLFPHLRYNKAVIDFYLNVFVFPRHTKGFGYKISTSGWDIAITKPNPTTGFSGTNDGRFLLPTTITQIDRNSQLHTNAKVLSCILDEAISSVKCHPNSNGSGDLLKTIYGLSSRTTVILDVGAQILDLSNMDFAKRWLAMYQDDPTIKAAVFFDEWNDLLVLTLDGLILPLIDSPYSNRLNECLVYLDEAHTRGTDLRLPDTQAAVTLGPKLNKDKLVQGCMRMRRLGQGHTLVFMASEEISSLIIQETSPKHDVISTEDIIVWSIKETWKQLQADLPAWVAQGHSFVHREAAWQCLSRGELESPEEIAKHFNEKETRSLDELYGSQSIETALAMKQHSVDSMDETISKIAQRRQGFDSFVIIDARMGEEMEIELMHEKEVEREVERAPDAEPAQHSLHPNVERYVASGDISLCHGQGFRRAADAFSDRSLVVPQEFDAVFSNIVVTEDFWRTIKLLPAHGTGSMHSFMRSVDWVVTDAVNPQITLIVLLSPYEVNQLLPQFRTSTKVKLHVYAPHSNLALPSLEDLDFLTFPSTPPAAPLPRSLSLQLSLFSGSIYFRDYKTYQDVCRILRLHFDPLPEDLEKPGIISASFFIMDSQARVALGMTGPGFDGNALSFFQKMVEKRRFGREFGPSHFGRLLDGDRLKELDFPGEVIGREN